MLASPQPLTVYASTEIHSCNQKAVELLGLGTKGLRKIPVNEDFTINLEALKQAIADDRAAGYRPICVIGSAGTVNTGAVDDLNAIADLCREEDLWFHVDGAIGAVAVLAGNVKPQLAEWNERIRLRSTFINGCISRLKPVASLSARRAPIRQRSRSPPNIWPTNHADCPRGTGSVTMACNCRVSSAPSRCGCRSRNTASTASGG